MIIKSWGDVDEALKRMGLAQILRERTEGKLNEGITKLKDQYGPQFDACDRTIAQLTDVLEVWCSTHRDEMEQAKKDAGRTWHGLFGKVAWRKCPPAVVFLKSGAKVLLRLQALKLANFIRTIEEPNKEAMHLLTDEQLEAVGARRQPSEKFEVKPDYKEIAAKEES